MSDLDPADVAPRPTRLQDKKVSKDFDELTNAQLGRKTIEREGLPAGYRMRADAHYVDQLTARSADMPVRWISVDEIAGAPLMNPDELGALVQSIVEHGIVQPLLVRQSAGQYRLIAGRKRLAAARAAVLSRVPCLVHQVDDAQAEALALADNLRVAPGAAPSPVVSPAMTQLLGHATDSVTTIGGAAALLANPGSAMSHRVALDLVKAETWRTGWQLRAATILEGLHEWRYRLIPLSVVLGRVGDGFAAESRLSGIVVKPNLLEAGASVEADEEAIVCGLTGIVMATAGVCGSADRPEVALSPRSSGGKSTSIDVTQDAVAIAPSVAGRFLDATWVERPGGWPAALGVGVAKAVAQRHGGELLLIPREGRGSTVRLTVAR